MGAPKAAHPEGQKRMKLSHLDYLSNPLRSDHPFGKCVAKEAAAASEGGSGTRASANAAVCGRDLESEGDGALHGVHMPVWKTLRPVRAAGKLVSLID